MSRYLAATNTYTKPTIIVTDNDILSGRGVNIASHPGNERFRTLITTRADASYCLTYSATEKKAVAEEIVRHICSLDPPGRFLKREGRGQISRGLNGPWEELSRRDAIKKTCQALRDCNRIDRETYALGVEVPEDVKIVAQATSGVDMKAHASKFAEELSIENSARLREAMENAGVPEESIEEQLRRKKADATYVIPGFAMTSAGSFAPIAPTNSNYPLESIRGAMGPNGMLRDQKPASTSGQMPAIYSVYPHPAFDMAPINMEAHLAARIAAGYVHPDDRPTKLEQEEIERIEREHEEEARLALLVAEEGVQV